LTERESGLRVRENLLATYLAIGRTFPGAVVRDTDAFTLLLSDLNHPSGNFAARLSLDPWSAADLRRLAASRDSFQVVALSEDAPEHLTELLRRAGFKVVHRLVSMIAHPREAKPEVGMAYCTEPEERLEAGRFIAEAFFSREPVPIRQAMAEAVANAPSLAVHSHIARERIVAAVTLSREADILGIYNLCVAPPQRGKGLGSAIVRWCLAQAAQEGRPACLQCTPALEPWYAHLGFTRSTAVTVWSLPKEAPSSFSRG
jgi:N-acetylglutamate synthase-like GNAT family acetyltransferase